MESILVGQKAVAEIFEVTERTVRNWIKAGMPRLSKRRFDRQQIRAWLDQRDGQVPAAPARGPGPRQPLLTEERGKDFQDERLKRAKADLAEMEVRRRRSELVEWSKVEEFNERKIMEVKQRLLILSQSLPPRLINLREREMVLIIHRAIHDVLVGFSQPAPANLRAGGVELTEVTDGGSFGVLKKDSGGSNQI
jgi:phage terminase Nu1 subunit (DNA packaging protein)